MAMPGAVWGCPAIGCLLLPGVVAAQDLATDYSALKALWAATGGDNWTNDSGWDLTLDQPAEANPDRFLGVTTATGSVTRIGFRANNLDGTVTSQLGDLHTPDPP